MLTRVCQIKDRERACSPLASEELAGLSVGLSLEQILKWLSREATTRGHHDTMMLVKSGPIGLCPGSCLCRFSLARGLKDLIETVVDP